MDGAMGFPNGTYIFLWGGIVKNAGGMTRAMLKRAELMISEDIDIRILLCARGMEQLDGVEHYNENGFPLIRENNFIAMETYFGEICSDPLKTHQCEFDVFLEESLHIEEDGNIIYFKDGIPFLKEYKTDIIRKRLITVLNREEEKLMDLVYWDNRLSRIIEYRDHTKSKITRFFSKTGFCFLRIIEFKAENGYNVERIILFNEREGNIKEFKTLNELSQFFFSSYVNTVYGNDIFVFHDPFLDFDPGFARMFDPQRHIYRIGINHGCGFGDERQWYSKLNPRIRDMIEQKVSPDIEAFICLTCEAVNDFTKRLGRRNIIYQIPNMVCIPERVSSFEKRDKNRVVFIGRFSKQKQISHLLKAWKIVERAMPGVYLYLYGRGELEQQIKVQIKEDKLMAGVVKPFSNSVSDEYQKASLSIVCSDFEGFSLSLLESLANGCPVVTYDFKYGPRDVIIDGKNGFICEKNNIEALADAIIKYLQMDDFSRKQMSDNARVSVTAYQTGNYRENWVGMLNEMVRRYPGNLRLNVCEINVISYNVNVADKKTTYNCQIKLDGFVPQIAYGQERIYIKLYTSDMHDYSEVPVNSKADYEGKLFEVSFCINSPQKVSLCILWNNSFYEKIISEKYD